MDSAIVASADAAEAKPQARVAAHLTRAYELQRGGDARGAGQELELALELARATPYEVQFQTRVELALALCEAYLAAGEVERARVMLDAEVSFAEKIFEIMRLTGTPDQKRAAAGGRVQLRDRARQVAILGAAAPEIAVKNWINGEATALADL